MYHELTEKVKRKRTLQRMTLALASIIIVVGSWLAFDIVDAGLREQGELSLRNAILNSAKQCCAIEGSYPTSIRYLEDNYGLVVNHESYTITYEVFAGNVMPSVVVIAK